MNEHVSFELVLNKTLPTDLTFEGPFSCVNSMVPLQILLKSEVGSTDLTGEYLATVNRLV